VKISKKHSLEVSVPLRDLSQFLKAPFLRNDVLSLFSFSMILEIAAVIGICLVIWYALSWAFVKLGRRAGVSRAQLIAIRKGIRVLTLVLAVAGILNVVGLESQFELLTIGGIGVLLVSLSLQGFLSSVFYGFLAFSQDTIRLGDVVEVSGAGKGRVVRVALRNIWIKTDAGALVVIDNTRLEHGRLWNYSAVERLEKHFDSKSSIS